MRKLVSAPKLINLTSLNFFFGTSGKNKNATIVSVIVS